MPQATNNNENNNSTKQRHLEWSEKQRRILTANDRAEVYYVASRGFPFTETELPHHYLLQGNAEAVFSEWKKKSDNEQEKTTTTTTDDVIVGAWRRPLFYGGWEHTTDQDETVYNLQSNTLFIDLRIPTTKANFFSGGSSNDIQCLEDMNKEQLALYARQHVFAGYSRIVTRQEEGNENGKYYDHCCTRHYLIDWNFVGVGRTRPNKWWIEKMPSSGGATAKTNVWKEWGYATDDAGQHSYCERWERWEDEKYAGSSGKVPVVALIRRVAGEIIHRDGLVIIVGDHFNYCFAGSELLVVDVESSSKYDANPTLVSRVDAALGHDDLITARSLLHRITGGHGRISSGWKIDHAIEFWREGTALLEKGDVRVDGEDLANCKITWGKEKWEVFESNLETVQELTDLLPVS